MYFPYSAFSVQVNPKGNQPWIFIGRTDAKAEAPILWPPNAKSWLIGKDPNAGKEIRQKKKGMWEEEMIRWHHWFNGHEFEKVSGDGEGQGSLACYSPQGHNESDMTKWLRNNCSLKKKKKKLLKFLKTFNYRPELSSRVSCPHQKYPRVRRMTVSPASSRGESRT